MRYSTDTIWGKVFYGASDSPAKFEVISSKLDSSMAGGGFAARYTYDVEGKLTFGGKEYPIKAHGTRAAAIQIFSARRQAVELAIVDAAKQSAAILNEAGRHP